MILFLHGEDQFLLHRRQMSLKQSFKEKYPQAEIFLFDFEDQRSPEDMQRIFDACADGLFSSEKMIVVFHPSTLVGQSEKLFLDFFGAIERKNEKTVFLFLEPGKIKKTNTIIKTLLRVAHKEEIFLPQTGSAMESFAQKELLRFDKELKFSRQALALLVTSVGNNTALLLSEIEKLAAYKAGAKVIEEEDVVLLRGDSKEEVLFEALDALGRGDRKRATTLLSSEATGSAGAYPVLAMCAWQVRRMLAVREAYDGGARRANDIVRETKLPPFVVQKTFSSLDHFSAGRLKAGLVLLSDYDVLLKTGGMEPDIALHLFVWKF